MKNTKSMSWVVYRMTIHGKTTSVMNAVCEQGEWDAMERNRPGHHTLILAGIANEGEAERLARSSPLPVIPPTACLPIRRTSANDLFPAENQVTPQSTPPLPENAISESDDRMSNNSTIQVAR